MTGEVLRQQMRTEDLLVLLKKARMWAKSLHDSTAEEMVIEIKEELNRRKNEAKA